MQGNADLKASPAPEPPAVLSRRLVSAIAPSDTSGVPSALLDSADQIFAAGGYSDAARAYARLAVRFGSSNDLTTRRFVALIASRDCDQAAAVMHAALIGDGRIAAEFLPQRSLNNFYGPLMRNAELHCEFVAKYAWERRHEALPLIMIGKWLQLDNQFVRAQPFFARAIEMDETFASIRFVDGH